MTEGSYQAGNSDASGFKANHDWPRNPFVFIVGCPRSGTTLLRRMVNAHPQIAITRETHWISRWFKTRTGLTPEGMVTPELIPSLFQYHRFPALSLAREEVERLTASGDPLSYADFVTALFDLHGKKQGKPLVGDKTPGYVRNIPLLHSLWPKVRFVHLIRDGRDVCLSMRHWRMAERALGNYPTWAEDPVSTIALWWEWHVRLGRLGGLSLAPGQYWELRYESLVSQPEKACMALCNYLEIPFDGAMLRYNEGRTRECHKLSANKAWLPPTPGLRDWRSQMDPHDLERFEAVASELLDELDYPRGISRPEPEWLKHACFMRDLFTRHVSLPAETRRKDEPQIQDAAR